MNTYTICYSHASHNGVQKSILQVLSPTPKSLVGERLRIHAQMYELALVLSEIFTHSNHIRTFRVQPRQVRYFIL